MGRGVIIHALRRIYPPLSAAVAQTRLASRTHVETVEIAAEGRLLGRYIIYVAAAGIDADERYDLPLARGQRAYASALGVVQI